MKKIAFIFLFSFVYVTHSSDNSIQVGKFQYELIQRDTKLPKYGECWTESLQLLENGCKNLNDQVQSRLALTFANCFLSQSGQKTYPCSKNQEISACLSSIDSNAFTAYSNFFTVS